MKKIIILFLIFLLSIFVSCKSNNTNNIENKDDLTTSTDPSSDIEDDKEIDPDENEKENNQEENNPVIPPVEPQTPITKLNLEIDVNKYLDKSIFNINLDSYKYLITDVKYAVARKKDSVIVFDETNTVNTNIYGWEIGVDKYGNVVSSDVNVKIPSGGFVISGHGIGKNKVQEIKLGDFILFYGDKIFVYENEILNYNPVFLTLYKITSELNQIEDIETYNKYITILNNLKDKFDLFYNGELSLKDDLLTELNKINIPEIEKLTHTHSYTFAPLDIPMYNKSSDKTNHFPHITFNDLKNGGPRLKNYMVLYNENNLIERNSSGIEIAIDKDGYVVEIDKLVTMPTDGYIISGHLESCEFLETNVSMYDKIIIDGSSFTIYKDYVYSKEKEYIKRRNDLLQKAIDDNNNDIPHDYIYIKNLIFEIDKNLDELIKEKNIHNMLKANEILNNLESLTLTLRANLMSNTINKVKGIWYYPFKTLDDTSLEGVLETINLLKSMGINRLIVNPWIGNYTLVYNSTDYVTYPNLETYDYGEYGHDYLKCLVAEAHKENISIGVIDPTFAEKIKAMKQPDKTLYQMEYNGQKSQGNIYYLDICNDKVQDLKYQFYIDLVSNYDFDFIEFDIIRYSASNLRSFKGVITDKSSIKDPGWTSYSINKFKTLYNINGDLKELILTDPALRETWMQFKQNELDNFLLRVVSDVRKINPNIKISAATLVNYESAKTNFLQDFRKWHELGILDRIEGMNYNDSTKYFVQNANKYFSDPEFNDIALGIMTTEYYTTLEQIDKSLDYNGYALFSSSTYLINLKSQFTEALIGSHHNEFISELTSDEDILKAKINEIIDMLEGYYTPKYNIDFSELVDALKDYRPGKSKSYIKKIEIDSIKEYLLKKFEE